MTPIKPPSGSGRTWGSASGPDGRPWDLWDRLIIIHWAGDSWCVGVEAPAGHYERLPFWFPSYADARGWLIDFQMAALA